jgi:hypothetical protein
MNTLLLQGPTVPSLSTPLTLPTSPPRPAPASHSPSLLKIHRPEARRRHAQDVRTYSRRLNSLELLP